MTAKTLMIQGTSSSAGKSLLTAAICRCFARRGVRVAPFKAQNMSNNAAVCADGSEIGRSQALQAIAAGVPPTADMNPILLKPEGDSHSQVIVNGRPLGSLAAAAYFRRRSEYWGVVTGALDRMRDEYELVVIEGAGSPAELNLADVEMVNMSVARYCQSPVLLVGDIERGGVFAQLLGTLWLLTPEDRALVRGLIVNKFRGDLRLFDRGVEMLETRGEVPVLGVLPWIDSLRLPEEDAATLSEKSSSPALTSDADQVNVVVIQFPHIANFDDFDPLENEPGVSLGYVRSSGSFGRPDLIILPGTKNTIADLDWLRSTGLERCIMASHDQGSRVVGICGGYQMLGRRINNPHHLEHARSRVEGLGLLEIETTFQHEKQTFQVETQITDDAIAPGTQGQRVRGYEIHVGQTVSQSTWLQRANLSTGSVPPANASDGARSADGRVWGCYLHGLFHNDAFRHAWLRTFRTFSQDSSLVNADDVLATSLDRLADAFESHVDIQQLDQIIWPQEISK
tara:strand:- start:6365 stop:7900 length:1536 start_codon:yes stop_codon:yes gene_type:complete